VRCVFLLAVALCAACASPKPPPYRVHESILSGARRPPERVLLLPAEVHVLEVSSGGMLEEAPERSRSTAQVLDQCVRERVERRGTKTATAPELTGDELLARQELGYRFLAAAQATLPMPAGVVTAADLDVWWPEIEHFDLSLGNELAFLAERTGCEAALFTAGVTIVPTGGRKVSGFFMTLLSAAPVAEGGTQLFLGLVDLKTGDLLWLAEHSETDYLFSSTQSLVEKADVEQLLDELLAQQPGVEAYRELLAEYRAAR